MKGSARRVSAAGALVLGTVAAALAWTGQTFATEVGTCLVTIVPPDAPERWREAARLVQDRIRREATVGDCAALTIAVAGERASVLFTTQDGRSAVRSIVSPDDLGALVDALLVTLPVERQVTAPAPSTPHAALTEDHAPEPVAAPQAHFTLRALAGTRISSPGAFASPSFGASAGVLLGPWEVSVFGLSDPVHALLAGAGPRGFTMSRYAVGVAVGRRVTAGATAIAIGLSTGVAVTREAGTDDGDNGGGQAGDAQTGGATAAEPLVATYLGLSFPRRSSIRLRPEVSAELVASRIGRTLTIDPALPPLPWWNGAATLAIEWEVR